MKKIVISFIAAFGLIAAGLIIMMVYGILHGGIDLSGSYHMDLVKTENVSLDGVDTITISYNSEDIDFYTSDTNQLVFKEYMNYKPQDAELSRIETNGNELSIKDGHEWSVFHWSFNRNHRVEIYLPSGYTGKISVETSSGNIDSGIVLKLSDLTVKCSSGNIKMNEVYADSISARCSSGNVTFDVAEGNRDISATSGNIKVSGGTGDGTFHTSSGNITLANVSGYIDASSSSGELKIQNNAGGGSFHTSSGNIALDYSSLTGDLKADASSGNIKLTIPENSVLNFTADTSSGDIHTFFDEQLSYNKRGNSAHGTVGENPSINVNLHATSGNIKVQNE